VRVPAIVISPLARTNFVDHTPYDTTAILASIEKRFGVSPLNSLDTVSPTLINAFNTTSASVPDPAIPPMLAFNQSGSLLTLSWPTAYLSYALQANYTDLNNPAAWVAVAGVANNTVMVPMDNTQTNVFYRLAKY
jgi:hypothetical protein